MCNVKCSRVYLVPTDQTNIQQWMLFHILMSSLYFLIRHYAVSDQWWQIYSSLRSRLDSMIRQPYAWDLKKLLRNVFKYLAYVFQFREIDVFFLCNVKWIYKNLGIQSYYLLKHYFICDKSLMKNLNEAWITLSSCLAIIIYTMILNLKFHGEITILVWFQDI